MAPGEATGLGVRHQASDEERLRAEAPRGAASVHLLRSVPYWERLHRFELLPCRSAAGWRPPASCGGLPHALGLGASISDGRLSE